MAQSQQTLFTENIKITSGSPSCLTVRLGGRGLGDEGAVAVASFLDTFLAKAKTNADESCLHGEIDLSENGMSNKGLIVILDALTRGSVISRILKFHKNRIGDEGGARLAELIRDQKGALIEAHFSHNAMTAKSLVKICMAIAKHENYPAQCTRNLQFVPCWLRMEMNIIARPQEVLDLLKREAALAFCSADNRDLCGPWRCACSSQFKERVARVHVFAIANQSQSRQQLPLNSMELCDIIRNWGGARMKTANAARPRATEKHSSTPTPGSQGVRTPGGVWANPRTVSVPTSSTPQGVVRTASNAWGISSAASTATLSEPCDDISQTCSDASLVTTPSNQSVRTELTSTSPGAPPSPECHADEEKQKPSAVIEPTDEAHGDDEQCSSASESIPSQTGECSSASESTPIQTGDVNPNPALATSVSLAPSSVSCPTPSTLQPTSAGIARRISPEQLGSGGETFVCPVCSWVLHKPVFTSCSHMVCEACVHTWAVSKVKEHKARSGPAAGKLELIPCPHSSCSVSLRKQDIQPLATAKDSAARLCERMRQKLQVRCVHHVDHFRAAIGEDAQRVSNTHGVQCLWVGDLSNYDTHLESCCVQKQLDSEIHSCGKDASKDEEIKSEQDDDGADASGSTSVGATESVDSEAHSSAPEHDIRVARHDYMPEAEQGQIAFKKGDLVHILSITEAGWAAGSLVSKDTMQSIGEPGWFPIAYIATMSS